MHMAERGYMIAAFDPGVMMSLIKRAEGQVSLTAAATALDRLIMQVRRELGLPDATPTILTGYSRGSNLVVFAAGERDLRRHLLGGVAVALTREADHLQEPDPARNTPALPVDDRGRLQTYPAISRLGALPFAVIQSAGDSYVRAEESRRLFGPDTPTRRLYEVDAIDHAFDGGHEALLHDLDDALAWIIAHNRRARTQARDTPAPVPFGSHRHRGRARTGVQLGHCPRVDPVDCLRITLRPVRSNHQPGANRAVRPSQSGIRQKSIALPL